MVTATCTNRAQVYEWVKAGKSLQGSACQVGLVLATALCARHEMEQTSNPYDIGHRMSHPLVPNEHLKHQIFHSIQKMRAGMLQMQNRRIQASARTISLFLNSVSMHAHSLCKKTYLSKQPKESDWHWQNSIKCMILHGGKMWCFWMSLNSIWILMMGT